MNTAVKLIALDMDGTVFTDQKTVTPRTLAAIRAALDRGIVVVPASGRTLGTLPPQILSIPGIRYVITCNGARVTDQRSGQVVSRRLIPLETALELTDALSSRRCVVEASIDDQLYLSRRDAELELACVSPALRPFMAALRTEIDDLRSFLAGQTLDAEKMLAFMPDDEAAAQVRRLLEGRSDLDVSFSVKNNLEINAAGASKGSALAALAEHLRIPREAVMACGDSGNDVSMLEYAGFSVAMGNAVPELKALADAVTLTNNEDGVAAAIERYVLPNAV